MACSPTRLASVLLLQLLSNTSDRSRISDCCDRRQNKTHTFQKESKNIVLPLCSQSAQPFQSLATRADAWQAIPGVSMWVMTMVRRVYTLQFARRPPHRGDESAGKRIHRNRSSSPERVRLFPRPQKIRRPATYSRSQTPELRPDEKVIQDDQFKQILPQICPGDWFMPLDLKDAYIHIQVAPIIDDS